jgi:sortase A
MTPMPRRATRATIPALFATLALTLTTACVDGATSAAGTTSAVAATTAAPAASTTPTAALDEATTSATGITDATDGSVAEDSPLPGEGASDQTVATLPSTVVGTVAGTSIPGAVTTGDTTVVTLPVPAPAPPPRAQEAGGSLGTIEIPKLGIRKPLYEGVTLNTLDKGPGHWPGTAQPGGIGNVVVAGHRTSHDHPFRDIDQLQPGDEVIFTTSAGRFVYRVTGTKVVKPNAMYIIDQTSTATATLFACHPPGSTRQRIVVTLALAG